MNLPLPPRVWVVLEPASPGAAPSQIAACSGVCVKKMCCFFRSILWGGAFRARDVPRSALEGRGDKSAPSPAQEVIGRSSTTRRDDYQIISHGKAEPQSPTLSRSAARGHRKTIRNTLRLLSDRRSWQGKCKIDRFHSTF